MLVVMDQLGEMENMQNLAAESELQFKETDSLIEDKEKIKSLLQEKNADGYFILGEEFIDSGQINIFTEEQQPVGGFNLENILSEILQNQRLAREGMEADYVDYLTARTTVFATTIGEEGELTAQEERSSEDFMLAIALAIFMIVLIMGSGSLLLLSAMQEKRDRMAEIILSSISSDNLMAGKIVGHFILGIIQLVVWSLLALPVAWYFFDLEIGTFLLRPIMPLLLLFALLGFFMFAALFVGIGATMEDMQSASNTQGMVFMIPWIPVIFIGAVFTNPGGIIAQVTSIFPLTSPLIMMGRLGLTQVPVWEVVASVALLLLTVLFFIKIASKLFRIGMLMYGKTATPREIWKWIWY